MNFKLVDKKPKSVPDRIIGHKSEKGFNTTITAVRSKCGADCLSPAVHKTTIDWKRINKELNRQALAIASFVSVPVLLKKDGSLRIPLQYQAKYLSR